MEQVIVDYVYAILDMADKKNAARIEELDERRRKAHDALAEHFSIPREELTKWTDDLPLDRSVRGLAGWLRGVCRCLSANHHEPSRDATSWVYWALADTFHGFVSHVLLPGEFDEQCARRRVAWLRRRMHDDPERLTDVDILLVAQTVALEEDCGSFTVAETDAYQNLDRLYFHGGAWEDVCAQHDDVVKERDRDWSFHYRGRCFTICSLDTEPLAYEQESRNDRATWSAGETDMDWYPLPPGVPHKWTGVLQRLPGDTAAFGTHLFYRFEKDGLKRWVTSLKQAVTMIRRLVDDEEDLVRA